MDISESHFSLKSDDQWSIYGDLTSKQNADFYSLHFRVDLGEIRQILKELENPEEQIACLENEIRKAKRVIKSYGEHYDDDGTSFFSCPLVVYAGEEICLGEACHAFDCHEPQIVGCTGFMLNQIDIREEKIKKLKNSETSDELKLKLSIKATEMLEYVEESSIKYITMMENYRNEITDELSQYILKTKTKSARNRK